MKRNKGKRALRRIGLAALCVLLLLAALPFLFPLSRPASMTGLLPYDNSEREEIGGTSFHFRSVLPPGDPAKGKLLLVHGLGASTLSFEASAPLIASGGYFVVSVDLPGFGYSGRDPAYDHSQLNRAKDLWRLLAVIDRGLEAGLAAEPWHLAGHSMGGGTVAAMALADEARTKSLALIDAALFDASRGSAAAAFPPLGRWLQAALEHFLLNEGSIRNFLTTAYGRSPTPEEVEGYLRPLTLPGTALAAAGFVRTARNEDARLLREISTPILALWGAEDTVVPVSGAEKLREIRPDAAVRIISGAAHCPMETHTEEFVRILLDWLASQGVTGE